MNELSFFVNNQRLEKVKRAGESVVRNGNGDTKEVIPFSLDTRM